ncbi:MAG TPA: SidA/IucD/PvdA family monooxygenase [Nocardioides sp.]
MRTLDFVGIGLGPFNLGLAALADPVADLDGVVLEAADDFRWHGGMMLPRATLQVPFLADLVTMADPTSRWSFLAHLKDVGRLYPFYIREDFKPLRSEYDAYCRWVAQRLDSVRFGRRVTSVERVSDSDGTAYVVTAATGETWRTRRVVLGVGTSPQLPAAVRHLDGPVTHTAGYLHRKGELQAAGSVTVVGSGQSSAEVFADLLAERPRHGYELTWVTRSPRFFPMEYTKLTLEMTSPEYTAYFQSLPADERARLLGTHAPLHKGISGELVDAIFDELYAQRVDGLPDPTLLTATELTAATWDGSSYTLDLHHREQDRAGRLTTGALVVGTGYAPTVPDFLAPVRDRLRLDDRGRMLASGRYTVDHDDREVFVQNAEEHTHGFVAPDLGMGAFRNSVIINEIAGREVYPVEKRIAVQEFGVPDRLRVAR